MKKIVILAFPLITSLANAEYPQRGNPQSISAGLSFEAGGAEFTLPKRVVIKRNETILFRDKNSGTWNVETDSARYFKFGNALFLVVSEWDTGDFTSFRLFHLGLSSRETKEYKIMGSVEDDNGAVFFTFGENLYYWEDSFCKEKKIYLFDNKKLDFVELRFRTTESHTCLPSNLDKARKLHEIKQEPVRKTH